MRAEMQAARRTMLLLIINEAQMIGDNPRATAEVGKPNVSTETLSAETLQ